MKALVRDYLASLRERNELDAVLPELLSELGFHVFSRPGRGTQQLGVDIAAIGKGEDGKKAVYLFSVKPGDLARRDWSNDSPQSLRPSLEEILDAYIPNRIPVEYKNLKIVICIVIGGEIHEHMREKLTGFFGKHTTKKISFQEWDGDRLADLVLNGLLREEILPQELRSSFRKSIAMLDEPDVAMQHFTHLVRRLLELDTDPKARLRVARQINICNWILYVWARGSGNIEAPYRASELALLSTWELVRRSIDKKKKPDAHLDAALRHVLGLHLNVSRAFAEKFTTSAGVMHGVSVATRARSPLDVNIALFEALGRIALWGLWMFWLHTRTPEGGEPFRADFANAMRTGAKLIENNPALFLPATDQQTTDIALFLQLWATGTADTSAVSTWLREMTGRLNYTIRRKTRYPSCSTDYAELDAHEAARKDEEYFKTATAGSTLIPVMAAWLHALGDHEAFNALAKLAKDQLEHCTLQLWTPDESSEPALYVGGESHGRAISDLTLADGGEALLQTIAKACDHAPDFLKLSPMQFDFWPIIFVACHYYRLPIPPQLWIKALLPREESPSPAGKTPSKRAAKKAPAKRVAKKGLKARKPVAKKSSPAKATKKVAKKAVKKAAK